jgi:site-specific recombinase XerC
VIAGVRSRSQAAGIRARRTHDRRRRTFLACARTGWTCLNRTAYPIHLLWFREADVAATRTVPVRLTTSTRSAALAVAELETAEVLGSAQPGEADVRGKGDRERTVFLDPAALKAISSYVNARGPGDTRKYVFVSHGNRRRRNDRLSPWSVWNIVKQLAKQAEIADPQFLGLSRALHTHDTRHHFVRTVLNAGAGLSVVQDLLGHASPATTKRIYATSDRDVLRSAARAHAPSVAEKTALTKQPIRSKGTQ